MNREFAFAEVVGLFAGFDETCAVGGRKFYAILNHCDYGLQIANCGLSFVQAKDFVADEHPLVALLGNQCERVFERKLFAEGNLKCNQDLSQIILC